MSADLPSRLQTIRAELEAITSGPWEIKEDCRDYPSVWHDQEVAFSIGRCADCGVEAEYEHAEAAFIASAPTTVAKLLGAVEGGLARMEERTRTLTETAERLTNQVLDRVPGTSHEDAARYQHYSLEAAAGLEDLRRALTDALGEK